MRSTTWTTHAKPILTALAVMACVSSAVASDAVFSLVNSGSSCVQAPATVTLEVWATFDTAMSAIGFDIQAAGDAGASLMDRSLDPFAPGELCYVPLTDVEPFDDDLPHDLVAAPFIEALIDAEDAWRPGDPSDGIPAGTDVLIETLDVQVTGTGSVTVSIGNPSAAETQSDPDGALFDTVSVDPLYASVTINIEPPPADDCNGNCIDDSYDISQGTSQDVNGNGVPDECETPVLTGAVSRKTHGAAGDWDIDVGTGDIESRSFQVGTANPNELLIVATFDIEVGLLGGAGDVTSDVGTASVAPGAAANELEITITDLPFNTQVNLTFGGVTNATNVAPAYASDSTLCVRVVVGDYGNDGTTNYSDFGNVRAAGYLNQSVSDDLTARADFDCGGRVNFLDFAKVNNAGLINQAAPACTPPIGP